MGKLLNWASLLRPASKAAAQPRSQPGPSPRSAAEAERWRALTEQVERWRASSSHVYQQVDDSLPMVYPRDVTPRAADSPVPSSPASFAAGSVADGGLPSTFASESTISWQLEEPAAHSERKKPSALPPLLSRSRGTRSTPSKHWTGAEDEDLRQYASALKKGAKSPGVIRSSDERYVFFDGVTPTANKHVSLVHGMRCADNRPVVVKNIKKTYFASKVEEKQWRASCRTLFELATQSNLCQLLEVSEDEEGYYVVMEKVLGKDLFDTLRELEGPMPMAEMKGIVGQILKGLTVLHDHDLVHRDLKLQNVMIKRDERGQVQVKIIDYDTLQTVKLKDEKERGDRVVGSDQYIAPEAYEGNYSQASDMFAVGVMMFALMRGRFPFSHKLFDDQPGENYVGSAKMSQIAHKLRSATISWPSKFKEEHPEAVDLCQWLLKMPPEQRPSARRAQNHPFLAQF
ncbi:ATG1C [Symbiodinium natans]|uniref:ATG1C protein n=1 Tax=Symbiodinium natans TaxID=878477 RepID=A0A812V5J7_9DINO|nr:ATG1C [Symbiodinium natans]